MDHARKRLWPAELVGDPASVQLPFKAPFAFVERVVRHAPGLIHVQKRIVADAITGAHFGIYPGSLQLELLGQSGVALLAAEGLSTHVRVSRVQHAVFLGEVHPGQTMDVYVQLKEHDSLRVTFAAQGLVEEEIAVAAVIEVVFA